MSKRAADVKSTIRLENFVESIAGQPISRGNNTWMWRCPLPGHQDNGPSFAVNLVAQRWRCFGACKAQGDVFDLFHLLYGDTLPEAIARIDGDDLEQVKAKPATPVIKRPKLVLTEEIVQRYAANWMPTKAYFYDERAIAIATIKEYLLGTQTGSMNIYRFRDGTEKKFFCPRYIIPWQFGGRYYQLSRRRDDKACYLKLKSMPGMADRIREDVSLRKNASPDPLSDEDLIEFMFGPKYKRFSGTEGSIFNLDQIFAINFFTGKPEYDANGLPLVARMDYNLISEAPVSAMSIESLGYSATAVNLNFGVNYRHAYSGVSVPIILQDNDKEAGEAHGAKLAALIGNPLTRRLTTPDPWKDPNEVIVYDKQNNTDHFGEWMRKNGIPPIVKRKE